MTSWMRRPQTYGIQNSPRTISLSTRIKQYGTLQKNSLTENFSQVPTKAQVDSIFGKGKWRGIRRRGLLQNDKVRGIDNARTSGTNFAAWLQDSIMTTPHDIAMQMLCWFLNEQQGEHVSQKKVSYGWASLQTT